MSKYEITGTEPTTYMHKSQGVVNGVLVRYRIIDYDEAHEIRVPTMNADLVKSEIEKAVAERDALANLGK